MARILDPVLLTLIEFDVSLSERYTDSVDWTEFPVESGLPITDHGVVRPAEIILSGIVSDTPLGPLATPFPDRGKLAYERLLSLLQQRRLLVVQTGLRVYVNMGIVSLELSRERPEGAVFPVVSLREIRIVGSITVPIPPELIAAPDAKAGNQSAVDAGKQAGSAAGPVTEAATERTAAKTGVDLLKGIQAGDIPL